MRRKLTVILASDVAGYSRLVAADEEDTVRRLGEARTAFGERVRRYRGRVFSTAGDAVLAEFASAVDATRCAIDIQGANNALNSAMDPSRKLLLRIGIAIGDVLVSDRGDLLGDGVNIAARLEGIAEPGGICVSEDVKIHVLNKISAGFEDLGEQTLKNIPQPIRAYRLGPAGRNAAVFATSKRSFATRLQIGGAIATAALLAVAGGVLVLQRSSPSAPSLQRIDRDGLCVTNGAISTLAGDRLVVYTPSSRAIVQGRTENAADQIAEIHFQYLGPSQDSKPLASGEVRRQIGLKLRAQDGCNLVYAMWRLEPRSRVVVSIKRNEGQHTQQQCGIRGYIDFKSQDHGELPSIRPGEHHRLRAELQGKALTVKADGKLAWHGSLGSETALPVGPPGLRTDNGQFVFEYFASTSAGSRPTPPQAPPSQGLCAASEGD